MIAFTLPGGIPVYTFALLVSCGACLGLVWSIAGASEEQAKQRLEAGLWLLGAALVGSRLEYVGINWRFFRFHPIEIIQVQLGGLSGLGGIGGWVIGLLIYTAIRRTSIGALADSLLPLAACLIAAIWLGCWLEGIAYGAQVELWWALPTRDEWGIVARRQPLQIMAALLTIFLFWLLDHLDHWKWAKRILHTGMKSELALAGIGLILLALSFFRADVVPIWRGIRSDVWLASGLTAISLLSISIQIIAKFWTLNSHHRQNITHLQESKG